MKNARTVKLSTCLSSLLVVMAFSLSAHAGTLASVVNWGPSDDYVAAHTDFPGFVSGENIDFSLTSALSPSLTSPGPGFNTTFYGGAEGFRTDTGDTVGLNTGRVNNLNPDRIQIQVSGTNVKNASLVLFRKDDFLGGGDALPVALDNGSAFSYRMSSYFNGDNRLASFVVGAGDMTNPTFYRSDTFSFTNSTTPSTVEVGFAGLSWFEYDPLTEIHITSDTAATPDFSNVSWLGLYGESTRDDGNARVDIVHFGVDATVIPEPGTLALLGLAGLVLLKRRRV